MNTHFRVIRSMMGACITVILALGAAFPTAGIVFSQTAGPDEGGAAQSIAADFISDDFHACAIDPMWSKVTPSQTSITTFQPFTQDAAAQLSVQGGAKHILSDSNLNAPRLLQTAVDSPAFEVEVKFDSAFTVQPTSGVNQVQGVIFAERDGSTLLNFVRFDFFSRGPNIHVTVARYLSALPTPFVAESTGMVLANFDQNPVSHMYLRVKRGGVSDGYWTASYSFDGQTYTPIINHTDNGGYSIYAKLVMNSMGVFAGNTGLEGQIAQIPDFTSKIDYFQTINPSALTDEDSLRNTLTVTPTGSGSGTVAISPTMPAAGYTCGEDVTLTPNATSGSEFSGWTGDLVSTDDPAEITMNGPLAINAVFTLEGQEPNQLSIRAFLPMLEGND